MKIAILGQGIMGSLVAYYLTQQQHDITVIDRDWKKSSAFTAAGMLAPFTELEKSPPLITEIGLLSLKLLSDILVQVDPSIYFATKGTVVLAHPQDSGLLQAYLSKINKRSTKSPFIKLSAVDLNQLEPQLCSQGAYLVEQEGQIDNQMFLQRLREYLLHAKVTFLREYVLAVKPGEITINHESYFFDVVIDCRGIGDKTNFPTLRAVRGEIIWVHAKDVALSRPVRVLHPRYSIYIVPRPQQIYLIGATEIESHDDSPITVRSELELLGAALAVHKGFLEARIVHTATNLRPTLPDGLPRIKIKNGLIAVNGLYRHGFLVAPYLAQSVASFIEENKIPTTYSQLWENDYDVCCI